MTVWQITLNHSGPAWLTTYDNRELILINASVVSTPLTWTKIPLWGMTHTDTRYTALPAEQTMTSLIC